MSKRLFLQSSIYSVGQLFSLIAGLISYPILTKNLSVSEYGLVALITVTIGLITSTIKFGLQHSIIRFYHELNISDFTSNIINISSKTLFISSSIILMIGLIANQLIDITILKPEYFIIIVISGFLQAIQAYITNVFIVKEKSKTVALISIIHRLISLVAISIAILLIEASAISFIISLLITEILFTIILFVWSYKQGYFSPYQKRFVNSETTKNMFIFGIPMLGYEMSNMIHAFVDRFMIEYFMGTTSLGLYSASYNMANIIGNLVMGGIVTAVVPFYLKTWKESGKEATEELLSNVNKIFVVLIPAFIAGLFSISKPLMSLMSTEAYVSVAYIVPIAALGIFINRASIIYAAGLQIKKSTKKLFQYVLESTVINIALNYIFIPKYGLFAAAIITIISYLWMAIRFYLEGRKTLKVKFDYFLLARSITYSFVMIMALSLVTFDSDVLNIIIRIISGFIIYLMLLMLFEFKYRPIVLNMIKNVMYKKLN